MQYIIANPTGNITVLVTEKVAQNERPHVVREIFDTEPSCEQVGFVDVTGERAIKLEMMGGEFCGNATLSAAAYCAKVNKLFGADDASSEGELSAEEVAGVTITVDSSGIDHAVEVNIRQLMDDLYEGTLEMPIPKIDGTVVELDGITHMIVPEDMMSHEEAEAAVKGYADQFGALAMGMLLYSDDSESAVTIEPLVYVKGSDTMVWEHGCASGSIAAAYYKHCVSGANRVSVYNPGGIITIAIEEDKLYLTGSIQL